jgi:hypothetical protein
VKKLMRTKRENEEYTYNFSWKILREELGKLGAGGKIISKWE